LKKIYRKYKPHYQANFRLAIPVVISQLGHTLVMAADSIIVGHFAGTISLAAVSLVNSLFTVIMVLGIGISYGLTPLVAQENGRRKYRECGVLLSNSLFINAVTGILLFVLIYFGMLTVIDHLGQRPEVVSQAKPYLGLLGFSIVPLMIFMAFKQFAEGLGFTKQAMMISIWGNVLNVVLGIIFVKGMFGIEPMGVKGVGWSTLIDRTVMAIVMGLYIFRSKNFTNYLRYFTIKLFNKTRILKILKIGIPVAMQYSFEVSAFGIAAILMGTIGVVQQAAHQVAISLAAMTYMMASGVSSAATIRSGTSFGSRNFSELRHSAISSYHLILVFMLVTAILFVGLNGDLPWLYTSDKAVILVASQLLIIAGVFQLFDGTQIVGLGILRGIGDVNIPTFITFLAYWIIGLPVAYYLGIVLNIGANGIWYGLTLGLLVSAGLLFMRFQYISKKLERSLSY
jgi:MATE family multidrug resistance protein